jgi:predicted  nucleic acid-binding Zn-ribbon protein
LEELGMTKSFQSGVCASDSVAQTFRDAVSSATIVQLDVEKFFLSEERYARDRIQLLDKIQLNIAEERRCLELHIQECRSLAQQAKKKSTVVKNEGDRVNYVLAMHYPSQLDEEERQIEQQLRAVGDRIAEIKAMSSSVEERMRALRDEEKRLEAEEYAQFNLEQDLEKAKMDIRGLEGEIDSRQRSLERKEGNIAMWNKQLESREVQLSRYQEKFKDDLRRIEQEEKILGIASAQATVGTAMTGHSVAPQTAAQVCASGTTLRAVMDDNDMSIDHDGDSDDEKN